MKLMTEVSRESKRRVRVVVGGPKTGCVRKPWLQESKRKDVQGAEIMAYSQTLKALRVHACFVLH